MTLWERSAAALLKRIWMISKAMALPMSSRPSSAIDGRSTPAAPSSCLVSLVMVFYATSSGLKILLVRYGSSIAGCSPTQYTSTEVLIAPSIVETTISE